MFVTIALLLIFTFLAQWPHAAFALFLLTLLIPEFILLYWHKFSYIEPKVKIITFMLPVLIVFGCFVALLYVFGLTYTGQSCRHLSSAQNPNLYRWEDGACIPMTTYSLSCFAKPNSCAKFGPPISSGDPTDMQWGTFLGCGVWNQTEGTCAW
eukprot:CAMPEP_0117449558 /NCGR_PEP_ID=MMETSP0759-20121206/8007_1 /TAXON_ID=63605 /ORGANISM="Percolomonas cosmopolitus, Strain WS" /LENGTH=152 /DNA_ID=CAMNT_0005242037 /DNA_START=385 /DNA_END=843 /DNA_ORIENTATION=-